MQDKPDLIGAMSLNEQKLIEEYRSKYVDHVLGELPVGPRLMPEAKDEEQVVKRQDENAPTTTTIALPTTTTTEAIAAATTCPTIAKEQNAQPVTVKFVLFFTWTILHTLTYLQQHTKNATTNRLKMALARRMWANDFI